MKKIKIYYRLIKSLLQLPVAMISYRFHNKTPHWGQQAFLNLFCYTSGGINDFLSYFISILHPPVDVIVKNTALTIASNDNFNKSLKDLDDLGFHVFEDKLSKDNCDELMKFALETPCHPRGNINLKSYFNPNSNHTSPVYDYDPNDLINNELIRKIMLDPAFVSIAQSYLGCKPILDVVSLWWSTANLNAPNADAAQFFHFDMERIKWLKFFIYLTDVRAESGPHCFIKSSHRYKKIHPKLLLNGYDRMTDIDVFKYYSANDCIEFCGNAGTIIAEDTRGLHKGKYVQFGNRLVLQLQFTNSLFGANYLNNFGYPEEKLESENSNNFPNRLYSSFR